MNALVLALYVLGGILVARFVIPMVLNVEVMSEPEPNQGCQNRRAGDGE